jgi:hypothetical protein
MENSLKYIKALFFSFPLCLHLLIGVLFWFWIFKLFIKFNKEIQLFFLCLLIYIVIYFYPPFIIYYKELIPDGWLFTFVIILFPALTIYQVIIILFLYLSEYLKPK